MKLSMPGGLFRKYLVFLLILVGGVLSVSSAVELYFSYQEAKQSIVRLERTKALAAASEIERYLGQIVQQLRGTMQGAIDVSALGRPGIGRRAAGQSRAAALAEQREIDFLRLLRNVPAITEIRHLDLAGKERLRVSRLALDAAESGEDFADSPEFLEAKSKKIHFSPVYFRNESEPFITIAVAPDEIAAEVTTAEVSIRAIWDVVARIGMGRAGNAYVVDSNDQLIAHPDLRLVLAKRDLSDAPQVRAARAPRSGTAQDEQMFTIAEGVQGGQALAVHAAIPALGWLVFVEQPVEDTFAPLRAATMRSVVVLALGLLVAMLASVALARRMVAPVRRLQEGAARVGKGELDHRIEIRTGDELEALADEFNQTTARLQDSQTNLEQKVQARTADLTQSLEQQTATAEVLKVMSSSPTDVQPVFDAIVRNSVVLCDALFGAVFRFDGELIHFVAHHNLTPGVLELLDHLYPMRPSRDQATGRVILDGALVHVHDALDDPDYRREVAERGGWRSMLAVPMSREGTTVGVIWVARASEGPFPDSQVTLLQTFADQAVIAIENVRLYSETTEALEQQTAASEVLRVISSSPNDTQPVFDMIARRAMQLCGSQFCAVFRFDGALIHLVAHHGLSPDGTVAYERNFPLPPSRKTAIGRAIQEVTFSQIPDIEADPEYGAVNVARAVTYRSILAVPLVRDGQPIGGIAVSRAQVGDVPRQAHRTPSYLCRPGGDRHRERPRFPRTRGAHCRSHPVAREADRHRRGVEGHQRLADRHAARLRHHRQVGGEVVRGRSQHCLEV